MPLGDTARTSVMFTRSFRSGNDESVEQGPGALAVQATIRAKPIEPFPTLATADERSAGLHDWFVPPIEAWCVEFGLVHSA